MTNKKNWSFLRRMIIDEIRILKEIVDMRNRGRYIKIIVVITKGKYQAKIEIEQIIPILPDQVDVENGLWILGSYVELQDKFK